MATKKEKNVNKFDLKVGDYCTAYEKGFHKIVDMYEDQNGIIMVDTKQIATFEGKIINLNKVVTTEIWNCKPAIMYIGTLKDKINALKDVIKFIEDKFMNG